MCGNCHGLLVVRMEKGQVALRKPPRARRGCSNYFMPVIPSPVLNDQDRSEADTGISSFKLERVGALKGTALASDHVPSKAPAGTRHCWSQLEAPLLFPDVTPVCGAGSLSVSRQMV